MDYIYGKLCQKVKEVEYSGGTTDTIQVNVNNDTNVITADYIGPGGGGDATKEYVDQQISNTLNYVNLQVNNVEQISKQYTENYVKPNSSSPTDSLGTIEINGIVYSITSSSTAVFG